MQGRVASSDWSTQLEAERSAIKKMTADLERERLEVEEAKERFQVGSLFLDREPLHRHLICSMET